MHYISSFKGKLTHWQDKLYTEVVLRDLCTDISIKSCARNSKYSSFSICSPIALRNVLSGSTNSAEPLFLNSFGFIYMYLHISFLYVPAALVWQQMTEGYRSYHGHQVRCHHAEQSQFP